MFSVEVENTFGYGKKKKKSKKFTHGGVNRLETDEAIKMEEKGAHEVDHNKVRNNIPIMFPREMKVAQGKCLMDENGEDNPVEETALSEGAPPLRINLASEQADEGTHSTMTKEANVIGKIAPVGKLLRSSSHGPAWDDNNHGRDKSSMRYFLPRRNITVDCEKEGQTNLLVSPFNESNNPLPCYPEGCSRRGCSTDVPQQHFEHHISKAVNVAKIKLKTCDASNFENAKCANGSYEMVKGSTSRDSSFGNPLLERNIINWGNNDFALCRHGANDSKGKLQDDENEVHKSEERNEGEETDVSTVKSSGSVDEGATHGGNHQMGNLKRGDGATFDVIKVGKSNMGSHRLHDNILEYKDEDKIWEHSKMDGEVCKGMINSRCAINPVSVEGKSEPIGSDMASPEGDEMGGIEKKALTVNTHTIAQGSITNHAEEGEEGRREQIHNALRDNGTKPQTLFSADIEKNKMLLSPNGVEIKTAEYTYRCVHHMNREAKLYSNDTTVNFLKNNVMFLRKRRGNKACKKDSSNSRSYTSGSRNVNKEGDGKSKDLPKGHGVVLHMGNTFLPVPKGKSIFVEKSETNGKCPSRGRKGQSEKDVCPLHSGRTIFPLFTPLRRSDKITNKKVFRIRNKNMYVAQGAPEISPTVATNRKNDVHVNEFVKNKFLPKGEQEWNFLHNSTTHVREKSNVASSKWFYYDKIKGSNNPYVHSHNKNEDKWRPSLDSLLKNFYKERTNNTTGENYTNKHFIINRSRNHLKNQNKAFGISEDGTSPSLLANGEGKYTEEHSKGDVLKGCGHDRSCVFGKPDLLTTIKGRDMDVEGGEMGRTYVERAHSEYHKKVCEESEHVKELTKQQTEANLCGKNNNRIVEQAERFNFFHSEHDLFNGQKLRLYFSKGKNALHNGIFKIRGEVGIFSSIFKNFPFLEQGEKMNDAQGANQESISYECRYNAELVCRPGGKKLRDVAKCASSAADAVDRGCPGKEDRNDEAGASEVNSQNGAPEVHKIICGRSEQEEPVCAGSDDEATGSTSQMGSSARSCSNGRDACNEFAGGEASPGEGAQMSALSKQNDQVKDAKGVALTEEEDKCVLQRGDEEGIEISADVAKDDITNAVSYISEIEGQEGGLLDKEHIDPFFCSKDGELRMAADSNNLGCNENGDLERQKGDPTKSLNDEMMENFERIAERINFILDDTMEFFKKNLYVHNGYGSVQVYKEDTGWLGENTLGKWSRVYKINKVVCKGAHGVVFSAWKGEEGDDTGKQFEENAEKDAGLAKENGAREGNTQVEGAAGDSIDEGSDGRGDDGKDEDSDEGTYDEENLVTLKIMNLRYLSKKNSVTRIMKEVHFLQNCNHPNIVKYHESFFWPPCYLVIVCEFLSGGTLFDLYKNCGRITEDVLVHILEDVLKALKYLHNECPLCLVHRDIKPTNIVFSKSGVAKIIDFGSCEKVEDLKMHEVVGTLYYISPEILKREKYDCSADIWSLGITIYESVMCALPWKGKKDIEESIKQIVDSSPKINLCSGFSKQFCFFVESCLQNNPGKRAKVAHLLCHKFLTKKRLLRRKPNSIFEIRDILKVNNGKRKSNIFRNFFKNLFFLNDKNKRRRNKVLGSKSCEPEMFYQKLKRENFDLFEIKLRDENSRSLGHLHVGGTKSGVAANEEEEHEGKEDGQNGKAEPNVHDDGDAECAEWGVQRMNNLSSNYLDSKEDIAKQPDAA
ncbi:STE/STE20 protein kinase [Plasmodium fragile]|uniref:STE/STE20 protein kinase n=1 Tax=Plasmodium fragile TaxID=5857 RepID=A0A0D9QQG0_PLAFR|nr:STE/STE20 protein kinase [Plasmodium fragile]KJP89037.1 STE/STE20 protein kinase [Plasmodium fragile]